MIESATRLLPRLFYSFPPPLAELTRICVPSKSHHTGVTCGEPSAISVARCAKATLVKRSLNCSGIAAPIENTSFEKPCSSALTEIVGQLTEIVDQKVRLSGAQVVGVAESVGDAAGHHAGALPGFHVGIAVPNHERSAHRHLITPQNLVQQRRMGLLFRDTVAAQNRVEVMLNSQTLDDSVGEAMHFIGDDDAALLTETVERAANAGI